MAITKVKVNGQWELASPTSGGGTVTSVNGETGAVVLGASDVGALPDNTSIPSNTSDLNNDSGFITSSDIPVTSVNSKTGAVSLSASDVGALPSSTTIPTKVSQLQNDSGFTTNSGTVTSVRVQATSPVSSSVSTAQGTSLNTTISLASGYGDTQNPYGSKTKNQVLAAPSNANGNPSFRALVAGDIPDLSGTYLTSAPVTSVNSKTGAVSLSASDVGALPSSTTIPQGTVTSVRVQAISPVASSVSTAQSSSLDTTISLSNGYGDTQNPYGSKTANQVLAAPNGSNGTPSFRALAAADIPDLSSVYQKKPTVTTNAISSSTTYAYNSWTTLCSVAKPSGATFGMAFAYVGVSPNGAGKIRLSVGAGYDCDYYVQNTEYVPLSLSGYVTADTISLQINGRSYGGSASAASLTVVWF